MRISLLESRESFLDIFNKTMSNYWSAQNIDKIDLTTVRVKSSNDLLYGHRFFNFFARAGAEPILFEALKKEYSESSSFLKSIALKSYFLLSTNRITLPFMAHHLITVTPRIPEGQPFIIFGGNTRLRLIYPNKRQTVLVLKDGFNERYILNEIEFKEKVQLSCAPNMIDFDKINKTITEEYTPGYPINRLDANEEKQLKLKAWELLKIEVGMIEIESLSTSVLFQKYNKKLNTFLDKSNTPCLVNKALKELIALFKKQLPLNGKVLIGWSHGDFQNANILKTKTGIKIIDWETVDRRIILYDLITLLITARSGIFQKEKIIQFFNSPPGILLDFINELSINWEKERGKYLFFYLLEELIYRVQSSFSCMFYENGKGLIPLISTISIILKETKQVTNPTEHFQ